MREQVQGMQRVVHPVARALYASLVAAALALNCANRAAADETPDLAPAVDYEVDFTKHVLPILESRCFECHGPEEQLSSLRLDQAAAARTGGDLGPAYVAGDSAASAIVRYTAGVDPDITMPPEGEPLSREQIGVLRKWIDTGAPWPGDAAQAAEGAATEKAAREHWAFQLPTRTAPPKLVERSWPRSVIDAFVLARLEAEKIPHAAEASHRALIRRLSFDLRGLPPSPEEISRFLEDGRPDAYERLVDRYLAAPDFGERWAAWWLDLARYADTNGYEVDRPRSVWPYREWVIGALNANMPFDQFAIEQIAGDMLPNATLAQRVATGFHRNTFTNEEGGHDWEQFRFESVVDRVHTTATVFLGLTMACAQCHNHKYDPVSQREYFQFFALLNNADEPHVEYTQADLAARRRQIEQEIERIEAAAAKRCELALSNTQIREEEEQLASAFESWLTDASDKARPWTVLEPQRWTSALHATLARQDDDSLLASGDRPETDEYRIEYSAPLDHITAIRLEALPDPSLPHGGPGRGSVMDDGTFLLSEITVHSGPIDGDAATPGRDAAAIESADATYARGGNGIAKSFDGDRLTGWHVRGGAGRRHVAVFALAEPLPLEQGRLTIDLIQNFVHQQTLGRFRLSATTAAGPFLATLLADDAERALLQPTSAWSPAERRAVLREFVRASELFATDHERIAALRGRLPEQPTSLVMSERGEPRVTHQHIRGEYRRPGKPVEPGVPDVLHPLPDDAPHDRLALARWLVDQRNPLVGRVIVNHLWQSYFGRGLVTTPEDFGRQGARPSHPALLDSLACEFVEENWDLKRVHRAIAVSAVYRQSSQAVAAELERDRDNVLLARGPRVRLPAEMIRDTLLSASGSLARVIGGPSVYPPQPEGVSSLSYGRADWDTSRGDNRYRRAVYTHRKRGSPYPAYAVFDAPPHNTCTVHRMRSNTPLQALALLNDQVVVETSQAFARRVLSTGCADDAARLRWAFEVCVARLPTAMEESAALEFLARERAALSGDSERAATVAGVETAADVSASTNADDAEALAAQAAWTLLARALLNLDETVTKE